MKLIKRDQQEPQKLIKGMEFPDDIMIGTNINYETNEIETLVAKNKSPYSQMNEFIKTGGYNITDYDQPLSGILFSDLSNNLFIERLKYKINNIISIINNIYYETMSNIKLDFPFVSPLGLDAELVFKKIPVLGNTTFYKNLKILYNENKKDEFMELTNIATMTFASHIYNRFLINTHNTTNYNDGDKDNLITQDKLEKLVEMKNNITLLSSDLLCQMIFEVITMENFIDLL